MQLAVTNVPHKARAAGEFGSQAADEIGVVHPSLDDLLVGQLTQPSGELGEVVGIGAAAAHAKRPDTDAGRLEFFCHRTEVGQRNHFVVEARGIHARYKAMQHSLGAVGSQAGNDVRDADHETRSNSVGISRAEADSDAETAGANDATSIMDSDC